MVYVTRPRIPWDEIDPEIRSLVEAMNELEGIRTVGSCAGHVPVHGDYYEGYVALRADSITALQSIPFGISHRGAMLEIAPMRVTGAFRNDIEEGGVVFLLSFGGYPLSRQRELLLRCASLVRQLQTQDQEARSYQ